jgi:hypothetical protein
MRIICDHCSRPITGTLKRLVGNFNLHPECLAQAGKEAKQSATQSRSQDSSIGSLVNWKGTEPYQALHADKFRR